MKRSLFEVARIEIDTNSGVKKISQPNHLLPMNLQLLNAGYEVGFN
jgi:hypothetical protein